MQIEMCFNQYERYCIKGKPFVVGYPPLLPMPFAGLEPGDRVKQIGRPGKNGKVTSSNRVDDWEPWIDYAGIITMSGFSFEEQKKWMSFKLPPGGLTTSLKEPVMEPWYALYAILDAGELLRQNYNNGNVEIFKTHFTLAGGEVINKMNHYDRRIKE